MKDVLLYYKGFSSFAKYVEEDSAYHGAINRQNCRYAISGETLEDLSMNFMNAIDDFLKSKNYMTTDTATVLWGSSTGKTINQNNITMNEFVISPDYIVELQELLCEEDIPFLIEKADTLFSACSPEQFYDILLTAYARVQNRETGLLHLTQYQLEKPGFSLRRAVEEHGTRGYIYLEMPDKPIQEA